MSNSELIGTLIPIGAFVLFLYYFNPIILFLAYHFNNKNKSMEELDEAKKKWVLNFKVQINNPLFTIFAPIVVMLMIGQLRQGGVEGYKDGNVFLIFLTKVLIQPLFEEYTFRVLLLGSLMTLCDSLVGKKRHFGLLISLIGQALAFTIFHQRGLYPPLLVDGFVYGILFLDPLHLWGKRNLLPCTVAHITWNLRIFILTM